MYRNYKPHVALLVLSILTIIVSFICNGCAVETTAATNKTMERFTREYAGNDCFIITDNETGVQYLAYVEMSNYGRGVGLTKLEDEQANESHG